MFRNWAKIEMLRGASQPFETIAILIQRILIQCDIFPPLRPLLEVVCSLFPILDKLIIAQYDIVGNRSAEHKTDSMLPSNIQAVVIK